MRGNSCTVTIITIFVVVLLLSCRLFSLLNENFDTRLSIYGKEALGSANLEMIAIARKHGSCAKFCGSGGAIFGMCLDDTKKVSEIFMIEPLQCKLPEMNPLSASM